MNRINRLVKANLIKSKACVGERDFCEKFAFGNTERSRIKCCIVTWIKPPMGWIKLNSDGAARGSPGQAAGGGILRDHEGNLLMAYYHYYGMMDSFLAEAHALLDGLAVCRSHGYNKVMIETDSLALMRCINSGSCNRWSSFKILADIWAILQLVQWKCSHIFREGNIAADHMANRGLREMNTQCKIMNQCSGKQKGIVFLDKVGLEYIRFRKPP